MSSEVIHKVSEQRSRNMSAIKSKNTKPEIAVRKLLHSMGYRFRLHRKDLPGSPDIVLPKYKTVIFVHGCFWHRHENCKYASTPKTRQEFWEAKFRENINRDKIIKKVEFTHPYYDHTTLENQKKLHLIQNKKNILFCGSYFGYGFHEDGIKSSLEMIKFLDG